MAIFRMEVFSIIAIYETVSLSSLQFLVLNKVHKCFRPKNISPNKTLTKSASKVSITSK